MSRSQCPRTGQSPPERILGNSEDGLLPTPCTPRKVAKGHLLGVGTGGQPVHVHRGLWTEAGILGTRRHPRQHETPGFPWGLDFVYGLLGGGGKI